MVEGPEAKERVLLVEDDPQVRALLARILSRHGYRCTVAEDVKASRAWLSRAPYDLVICDVRLPDGSALDLVEEALRRHERMAALMISELDEVELAEQAVRAGVDGYIVKPISGNDVLMRVLASLRRRRTDLDVRDELRASREETIQRLCMAVEARDPDTAPHINQMSDYCWRISRELDLPRHDHGLIRAASAMHDLGKIAVPDRVLLKHGPLTPEERAEMERHAEVGYRILAGSSTRLLQVAATIAWTHHERLDGSGYPRGLKGEEIPLEGRIAAVADVFDALLRDRFYRPRFSYSDAVEILQEGRGSHFDSGVLDAFFAIVEEPAAERAAAELGLQSVPVGWEPSRNRPEPASLTPRELEVLQHAADGSSGQDIAEALVLSPGTVKTHFQHIYAKLDARDRVSAVAKALRRGLIE